MNKLSPFHLAIPVSNLEKNRAFYKDILECSEGRSSDHWVDFNFFGHQLVIHLDDNINKENSNPVDGKNVPIPHFGVVLEWKVFKEFAEKLKKRKIGFFKSQIFPSTLSSAQKPRISNMNLISSFFCKR